MSQSPEGVFEALLKQRARDWGRSRDDYDYEQNRLLSRSSGGLGDAWQPEKVPITPAVPDPQFKVLSQAIDYLVPTENLREEARARVACLPFKTLFYPASKDFYGNDHPYWQYSLEYSQAAQAIAHMFRERAKVWLGFYLKSEDKDLRLLAGQLMVALKTETNTSERPLRPNV